MNEKDRQVLPPSNGEVDLPERLWAYDDFAAEEDQPVTEFASGLASLGFIRAALRRCAWLWCATAVAGLVCGVAFSVLSPPPYQASTSVLITHDPSSNQVDALQTDMALAASYTVAERTVQKLHLPESAATFHAAATITALTDRVLVITVSASSSSQAVLGARALAAEFLQFRAEELRTQQQLVVAGLEQQINQAKQHINAITTQISQLPGQPVERARLVAQRSDAVAALGLLKEAANTNQANAEVVTSAQIKGSHVLDAAVAIRHSPLKFALIYAFIGLVVGLAAGLAIVIIRALVSDRLRRRDDIADALGAPVGVSAGRIRASSSLLGWHGHRAAQDRDVQRIAAQLRGALRESSSHAAALAVVSVDIDKAAARLVAALATSWADQERQVVVADLCPGAPAARLLGAGQRGIQTVKVGQAHLTVVVPAGDEILPNGPVYQAPSPARDAPSGGPLASLYARADILLTLVTLDPSFGGEHLKTWATDAVPVVSAGHSSWLRLHAVGEMIRLAQVSLLPAILVGAEKSDESLGMTDSGTPQSVAGLRILGR